ncbi:MAG: hypothetical protein HUK06_02020 [Bacteroidaceae bacterium]|nr:hypothetical protein [Bacteroidaceae bacterium]
MPAFDIHAQIHQVEYIDKFNINEDTTLLSFSPLISKNQTTSSNKFAPFITDYDEVTELIPDSIKLCVDFATTLWGKRISAKFPIKILIQWDNNIPNSGETKVIVNYYGDGLDNPLIPTALYKQNSTTPLDYDEHYDMTISINKNTNWDCSFDSTLTTTNKNLPTILLRSIAIGLGFGANLTENRGQILLKSVNHSLFNTLVFTNSGDSLINQTPRTQRMKDFCTNNLGDVYVKTNDDNYKLYTPSIFEKDRSLVFMQSQNSLMFYGLKEGEKRFTIDFVTEDIINKLGWETSNPPLFSIHSIDIDSTGICSGYQLHTFEIVSNEIATGEWSFWLPNLNNEYIQINSQANSSSFTIFPLQNENSYKKDCNGDIIGIIKCRATYNGQEYTADYYVTLELKPIINDIIIKEIVNQENGQLCDLYFDVYYYGANYLEMSIEREYSVSTRNRYIYEPYIAHIKAENIYRSVYSWIDIIASNSYGTDVKTIEISPDGEYISPEILNICFEGEYDYDTDSYLDRALLILDVTAPQSMQSFFVQGTDLYVEPKDSCQFTWMYEPGYEELSPNTYRIILHNMDMGRYIRLSYIDKSNKRHPYKLIYTTDYAKQSDTKVKTLDAKKLDYDSVLMISLSGEIIYEGNDINLCKQFPSGLYILKLIKKNNIKTIKCRL